MQFYARVLVIALLLAAVPAQARILKGRLFLGRNLHIFMQEDESLVTDLLRSISLVRSEVPVVNLNAAAIRPDQLTIGKDHRIYASDGNGAWVDVGNAEDVSALKLDAGVTLTLSQDVVDAFSGERGERLTVKFPDSANRVTELPRATFTDWLAELDRQGSDLSSFKAPPTPYVFLVNALADSLPRDGTASAATGDNFRALKGYVETGTFSSKTPLEQLLKRIKKDTQVKLVGGQAGGESTPDGSRLLAAYEALESALRNR